MNSVQEQFRGDRYRVQVLGRNGFRTLAMFKELPAALKSLERHRKRNKIKTGWVLDTQTGDGIVPAGASETIQGGRMTP